MTALSRREFGRLVVAGAPLAGFAASTRAFALSPVAVAVSTLSFRDLPRVEGSDSVDAVIRALQTAGATQVELALSDVEPAPPSTASFVGGTPAYPRTITFTPEEVARIKAHARRVLREWRARTEPKYFADVRDKLAAANLNVLSCVLSYDDSFSDDEIEATFRQVKALEVPTISSPMTMATARRLVPFADRHRVTVAIRNDVARNPAGSMTTSDLPDALALSPSFKVALDIANVTASNGEVLAELNRYETRLSHVVVRDRLRNGGSSQHLGEGDTPITEVVKRLKASEFRIPAIVEVDYIGLHSSVEEVTASIKYVARAIE